MLCNSADESLQRGLADEDFTEPQKVKGKYEVKQLDFIRGENERRGHRECVKRNFNSYRGWCSRASYTLRLFCGSWWLYYSVSHGKCRHGKFWNPLNSLRRYSLPYRIVSILLQSTTTIGCEKNE